MFASGSKILGINKPPPNPVDPFFSNVKLLMHMEGTNGSTTFIDQIGHAITPHGSAKISTAWSAYGTSSALFAAATVDYLTLPASTDYTFAGDFTIEFTVNMNILPGGNIQIMGNYLTNTPGHWMFRLQGSSSPIWYIHSAGNFISTAVTWVIGQPHKVALVRSATTCSLYIDGVSTGTPLVVSGTLGLASNSIAIGADSTGGSPSSCYVDEVRITNGTARYTANYTPSAVPFPNS